MTNISTKELIDLVNKHPCLWDRRSKNYQDKFAREKAWLAVFREAEPQYDSLKEGVKNQIGLQLTKKWYNVRDAFRKSLRTPRSRPYIYAHELSFMRDYYRDSTTEESPSYKTYEDVMEENEDDDGLQDDTQYGLQNDDDDDQLQDNNQENWINEVFVNIDDNVSTPSKTQKFASKRKLMLNDRVVNVLTSLVEKEEDEDRAFFQSLLPYVKSLSSESKFEFRMQVMQLIKSLKSNEDKTETDNVKDVDADEDSN